METIPGYDNWKLTSPEEYVDQNEIDILERTLTHCPFCLGKPFFEDSVKGWFVACQCGARMPGDSAYTASAKWMTRPQLPKFSGAYREGPRAFWPGA